jgi:hypothetical protein
LLLGKSAYAVHELERCLEIGEFEGAHEMVFFHDVPVGQLMTQVVQRLALERGNISAARNAGLTG